MSDDTGPKFTDRVLTAFNLAAEVYADRGDEDRAERVTQAKIEWEQKGGAMLQPYDQVLLAVDLLILAEAGGEVVSAFAVIPERMTPPLGPPLYAQPPQDLTDCGWSQRHMARWLCLLILVPENPDNKSDRQDALLVIGASDLLASDEGRGRAPATVKALRKVLRRAHALVTDDKKDLPNTHREITEVARRHGAIQDAPGPVRDRKDDTSTRDWVITGLAGLATAVSLLRKLDGEIGIREVIEGFGEDD